MTDPIIKPMPDNMAGPDKESAEQDQDTANVVWENMSDEELDQMMDNIVKFMKEQDELKKTYG